MEINLFLNFSTGVVTSPNHPGNYPNNVEKTETIQVESGKIMMLVFTHFDVYGYSCGFNDFTTVCTCDYVNITDGDGTTLMGQSCSRPWSFQPPIMLSRSNTVEVFFRTNGEYYDMSGWSLSWSALTPGQCPQST